MTYAAILSDPARLVLLTVTALLVKHFICDFVLQTAWQYKNKGFYGHAGGLLHATLHVVGTGTVLFVINRPDIALAAAILAGEFIIHYHLDYAKEQITRRCGWTPADAGYWWLMGTDQLLHNFTYVVIAALVGGAGRIG